VKSLDESLSPSLGINQSDVDWSRGASLRDALRVGLSGL
jgi:hypothetical protein